MSLGDLRALRRAYREARKGLIYIYTDKGPQNEWRYRICRADSDKCPCGNPERSAHLVLQSSRRWEGRKRDQVEKDQEFYGQVFRFLTEQAAA